MKKKLKEEPTTTLKVNKPTYQPSRKELREEIDMPGLSREASQHSFARPFNFKTI